MYINTYVKAADFSDELILRSGTVSLTCSEHLSIFELIIKFCNLLSLLLRNLFVDTAEGCFMQETFNKPTVKKQAWLAANKRT